MTFKRLCLNIIKAAYPDAQHEVGHHTYGTIWNGSYGTERREGAYVGVELSDGTCKRYYACSYEKLYAKLLTISFKG